MKFRGCTPGFTACRLGTAMLHVRVAFAICGERDGGMRLPEKAAPHFEPAALMCGWYVLAWDWQIVLTRFRPSCFSYEHGRQVPGR